MRSQHHATGDWEMFSDRNWLVMQVKTYIVVVRARNEDLHPCTLVKPESKTGLFLGFLGNLKSQSGVSPFTCLSDCMFQSGSVGNKPLLRHFLQEINHLLDFKAGSGHSRHGIIRRETAIFGIKKEGREEVGIDHRKLETTCQLIPLCKKHPAYSRSSWHQYLPAQAQHLPVSHPPTPPMQPGTPGHRLDHHRPCDPMQIRSLLR